MKEIDVVQLGEQNWERDDVKSMQLVKEGALRTGLKLKEQRRTTFQL